MFCLESPSLERENDIKEYINELVEFNSDINGIEILTKILEGESFCDVLEHCLNLEKEEYANKLGKSQVKTFLLIREEDNRIVGSINIRWNFPKDIKYFGGNIGYGIRPTERRKGYNTINLYLGLGEALKLGLSEVRVVCESSNIGSVKTIETLGGILEKKEIDPYDNVLTSTYYFNVRDAVESNEAIKRTI